ncbi:uncharacterized protein LOC144706759 [Wolffia australiana]
MARRGSEARGPCPLHQNPKFAEEKLLSPRPRPIAGGVPSLPPRIPAHYKKLWPNMAPPGPDLPFFLQRTSQEKALNYGVFDWRRLERCNRDRSRPLSFDFSSFSTVRSSGEASSSRKTQSSCSPLDRSSLLLLPEGCSIAGRRSLSGPVAQSHEHLHDSRRFSFGSSSSCEDSHFGRLSPSFPRSCPLDKTSVSTPPPSSEMGRCSSLSFVSPSGNSDSSERRRGGGSPFRRFLDPILRSSKTPAPSSPARKLLFPSASSSSSNGGSRKQALLRVSWKDGVPLLTFSANESEILAATRKMESEGGEVAYTFYCVLRGRKKVSGGWMTQGRKRELVSNVVGRMNVAGDRTTEFVLLGPGLFPTADGKSDGCRSSELAAVVVGEGGGSTVALLPRIVHGRGAGGAKAATLVERWRSGGRCDCGGWDAGCPLTVLRAPSPEKTRGGRRRIELFSPGGRGKGAAFSIASSSSSSSSSSREGVYTVEFDGSITDLQALAVCVAVLHGGWGGEAGELIGSRQCSPAAYCPPLSPVCRA